MTIKSILDPRIYGLIMITGLFGVGKTTLATTAEDPKLTAILDFDLKFKGEAERLGFWYRSPEHVQDVFSFSYDEMVTWFRRAIVEIPEGTTVVVIDNASPLEALLGYIVSKNPKEYGVNPANAQTGAYGGVNPGINKLWKNITLHLQKRGVRAIFVVNHVGSPWVNGQPIPNKFKGKGSKALRELANLDLVLVKGKTTAPAGIVLKEQFAQRTFNNGEWTIQRVLPLRFPRATWKDILSYFNHPANFEKPKSGEVPDQKELDMYGELFTQQQVDFIKAVANGEYVEAGEVPEFASQSGEEKPKLGSGADEALKAFTYRVMVEVGFFESHEEVLAAMKHLGVTYASGSEESLLELLRLHAEALPSFTTLEELLFQINEDFDLKEKEAKDWLKKLGFGSFPRNGEAQNRSRRMYWKIMTSLPPKVKS